MSNITNREKYTRIELVDQGDNPRWVHCDERGVITACECERAIWLGRQVMLKTASLGKPLELKRADGSWDTYIRLVVKSIEEKEVTGGQY